jgi:hypothetical protein
MANQDSSNTWYIILKTKGQKMLHMPSWPNNLTDTNHGHRATQYHGIAQHTRTLAPIKKRAVKIHGAKLAGPTPDVAST